MRELQRSDRIDFSVITVAYNDLEGVKKTRASVTRQWHNAVIQHVIVDAASTDGTREWLHSLDDDRVKWVSEKDGGIYDGMNKGARMADGQYIVFLNAGDTFAHPNVLTGWPDPMWRQSGEWGYGRAAVVDANGDPYRPPVGIQTYRTWRHAYLRSAVCHQAVVMRKSLFEELGGFNLDHKLSADYGFLLRAGMRSHPLTRPSIDVNFEAGGASSVSGRRIALEKHAIRVDVMSLKGLPRALDWGYAVAQEGYLELRRAARRTVTRLGLKRWLSSLAAR